MSDGEVYNFPPLELDLADENATWQIATEQNVSESETLASQVRDICAYHTRKFGLATRRGDWVRVSRKIVNERRPESKDSAQSTPGTYNNEKGKR